MTQNQESRADDKDTQSQKSAYNPNPVFVHYDRGLQEYGDLFSDDDQALEPIETAETQSHRP